MLGPCPRWFVWLGFVAALGGVNVSATTLLLHGKVVMEGGAPPPRRVAVEKRCPTYSKHLASTDSAGTFQFPAPIDVARGDLTQTINLPGIRGGTRLELVPNATCSIRAVLEGYRSSLINIGDLTSFSDPVLPTLVLTRLGEQPDFDMLSDAVPPKAKGRWSAADKAVHAQNWTAAESDLRGVILAAPRFALGWQALGNVFQFERKPKEAADAYAHAIELDPKMVAPYLMLARLKIASQDWRAVDRAAEGLAEADRKQQYPEAYVYRAIARYELKDLESAESSANEALRLDRNHEVPMAEYVLGLILEARREYQKATEHLSLYLKLSPASAEADTVRSRIQNLGTAEALDVGSAIEAAANRAWVRTGRTWIPGGRKALAGVAHMKDVPSPGNFFNAYIAEIARQTSFGTADRIPQYLQTLDAYMSSITQLGALGERRESGTTINISLHGEDGRAAAAKVLPLLGWRVIAAGADARIEPGHEAEDGLKQRVLEALGIDAIAMESALDSGGTFRFDVPAEEVPFNGVADWDAIFTPLLGARTNGRTVSGGLAGAFAADAPLAKAYAGLASMNRETAALVIAGVGVRALVTRYADTVFRYSAAFAVKGHEVIVPGGDAASDVWKKLAGASPADAPAFFRALLEKDRQKLAAYYFAVATSDSEHQIFFAQNAPAFYPWYRDSSELRGGAGSQTPGWRFRLIQELPLEADGRVRFPGGRRAWTDSPESKSEAETLLGIAPLEALVPLSQLEARRKTPLDQESARLLARNYEEWRPLFPYFEALPGLRGEDFAALDRFVHAARAMPPATQNVVIGEWDSLVELMTHAGLDDAAGAKAFRQLCDGLRSPDPSARAFEVLREIAGGFDGDVPSRLLRLPADRREAFHRVLELQKVPSLQSVAQNPSKDSSRSLLALSGLVYAASLDPAGLLVNEDPQLLSRHRFVGDTLFQESSLTRPGGYFTGTFVNFKTAAASLDSGGSLVSQSAAKPTGAEPSGPGQSDPSPDVLFRAEGRLVEVYATVLDAAGHPVDRLARDQFTLLDSGVAQKLVAFEPQSSEVSVALLLDTTGSMEGALPALKSAAMQLVDHLRATDSVAVYGFSNAVTELQPFTSDKAAAKRVILSTRASGNTALYDALTRVGRDLSSRGGKKVIVIFTDGNDNWSTLNTEIAIRRAKAAGVPVYAIAQGEGLQPEFLKRLASVSKATGGVSFVIRDPKEIRSVFERISADLAHGYLLVFQPASAGDANWRPIEILLREQSGYKIRAREGYYPN